VKDYTREQLLAQLKAKNHSIAYPLLVGVRSKADAPNLFDDHVYLLTESEIFKFNATTNPGTDWLLKWMNPKGAAVLKPGQYRYKIGMLKDYEALVQAGPVTVFRDANNDLKSDETKVEETGYFGIHIHRASRWAVTKLVGLYSAGCTVLSSPVDFDFMMAALKRSGKQEFFYSLLNEF
jgi:hypothetical protein